MRAAVIVAVIAATVLTTAGVTYAATSSSAAVKACVSSKGVLSLLSSKGKCAEGSREVSIDKQGPVGATGKTGKQGPKGRPGVAAPTPISIALDSTDAVSSSTFPIGSTGMTVAGNCHMGNAGAQLVLTGGSEYYVHGAAQYVNADSGNIAARTVLPSGDQTIAPGSSLIAYQADATSVIEIYIPQPDVKSNGTVQLYADLIVLAGEQSFSIHVYEYFDLARCQLSAQVVAS